MLLPWKRFSVRSYVLAWITVPLFVILVIDTYFLYRSALHSVNIAYDRTLLATTHAVGDSVRYENGRYQLSLPLALFEIYETDQSGRYFYRVSSAGGELVSGDEDFPVYDGALPKNTAYPAVVQFYEDIFRGEAVRVAVLFQPVFSNDESGTVVIQVAEPMKIRQEAARDILSNTLFRQGILIIAACLAVYIAVSKALKPLDQLRAELDCRSANDLSQLKLQTHLVELDTVTQALNKLMERLSLLINHQKRFIANASHQLRTPLAVLKTQLQSGLRGDAPSDMVLREMSSTVERTITLANQMLLMAKIEQRRSQGLLERCHVDKLAREAAIELSPLIADKNLDFEIETTDGQIQGDAWLVGELIRNLLNNAIRHTPPGQKLGIRVRREQDRMTLLVWDTGGGLPAEQLGQVFEPFSTSFSTPGSGLGLAISREIVTSLNGQIALNNTIHGGKTGGLDVLVTFSAAVE